MFTEYYTFLSIIIIILLLILVFMLSNDNNIVSKNVNKTICDSDQNFNYCINRNNVYFNVCPITNTSNSVFYNINVNGITCQFNNLILNSNKFVNSVINDVQNTIFGYTKNTGLYTTFERCLFNSIQNTVFDRTMFYRDNSVINVSLNNVSFETVKFLDSYYNFNIIGDVYIFSNCTIGDNTFFEFVGNLPIYVSVQQNVNEPMVVGGAYYFNGFRYILSFNNNGRYVLQRLNYV